MPHKHAFRNLVARRCVPFVGSIEFRWHWPIGIIALLAIVLVFEAVRPYLEVPTSDLAEPSHESPVASRYAEGGVPADLAIFRRRSLFRPATPLRSRTVGSEAVQRIQQRLRLNGISSLSGVAGAYITVQDQGLDFYKPGEGVPGMFTVQKIEDDRAVLEVLGQSIELFRK